LAVKTIMAPVHPGEILREEFLTPLGMSGYKLAKLLHVTETRVYDIVNERRSITAEMGLRLARLFGTSEQFWINLQAHYDSEVAKDKIGAELAEICPVG
jgi:addiction module HigA family antidote